MGRCLFGTFFSIWKIIFEVVIDFFIFASRNLDFIIFLGEVGDLPAGRQGGLNFFQKSRNSYLLIDWRGGRVA